MSILKQNIDDVYIEIVKFAKEFEATKVVLFGSRARGDNKEKSDIDIAIYGCDRFNDLKNKIDEDLWSLLHVDTINMEEQYVAKELIEEINKDGVVLYEKI